MDYGGNDDEQNRGRSEMEEEGIKGVYFENASIVQEDKEDDKMDIDNNFLEFLKEGRSINYKEVVLPADVLVL